MKTIITALLLCLTVCSGGVLARNMSQQPATKPSTAQPSTAKPGTQDAKTAAKQAAPKTTTATVDDATITANVKDKLSRTPSLKNSNINVSTKDGVVTLTGYLKNGGLKGVATNVTKSVKGVKKVDNQIKMEPKPGMEPKPKPGVS